MKEIIGIYLSPDGFLFSLMKYITFAAVFDNVN